MTPIFYFLGSYLIFGVVVGVLGTVLCEMKPNTPTSHVAGGVVVMAVIWPIFLLYLAVEWWDTRGSS